MCRAESGQRIRKLFCRSHDKQSLGYDLFTRSFWVLCLLREGPREDRLQRQLALHDADLPIATGVDIHDPRTGLSYLSRDDVNAFFGEERQDRFRQLEVIQRPVPVGEERSRAVPDGTHIRLFGFLLPVFTFSSSTANLSFPTKCLM